MIKRGGGRACNVRRFWTGQNNPPVLFIEHSFAREILIAWQDPVCARVRHILATTGRFGCASSVAVSEVLQGQQQVQKEKQITTVIARSEMSFAIDARTYLCRVPLDRIDVRTPQCRTHSHSRDPLLKISK